MPFLVPVRDENVLKATTVDNKFTKPEKFKGPWPRLNSLTQFL